MLAYNIDTTLSLRQISKQIELRKAPQHPIKEIFKLQLIDQHTIAVNIDSDTEFELEDAKRVHTAIQEEVNERKLYHLILFGDRTVPTREARQFCMSKEGSVNKLAEAIVASSLAQKMVFDFMINVERPIVRTKLFTSEIEALAWLQSLQN